MFSSGEHGAVMHRTQAAKISLCEDAEDSLQQKQVTSVGVLTDRLYKVPLANTIPLLRNTTNAQLIPSQM